MLKRTKPEVSKDKIDIEHVNEVVNIGKKILNLVYVAMIVGIILLVTVLLEKWGVLKFFATILKVAAPFFIGFAIAWILNPLVNKLQAKGLRRGLAATIVFLGFIFALFIFFWFLIPTIYTQLQDLLSSLPNISNSLENWINGISANANNSFIDVSSIANSWFTTIETFVSSKLSAMPEAILNSVGSIVSGIGTAIISFVISIYMLISFDSTTKHLKKLIPEKHREEVSGLLAEISQELRKCVNGTLLVALMVFIGDSIGFAIAGLRAPILFGILCGITDLIPYIGPFIGGAVAVVVGFSQGIVVGIVVLLVAVVVQLLENYVLQPVVMSKTMRLHPVTIIIGLLLFGHFFGIVGMILATPTIALVKVIYRFFAKKYNWFNYNKKNLQPNN